MNYDVCRDITMILTRVRCTDPGCDCKPQELALGILAHIKADPTDAFELLMKSFNLAVTERRVQHGAFELGLLLGIAISAASTKTDLIESIRAAQEVNRDIRDSLAKVRPQ